MQKKRIITLLVLTLTAVFSVNCGGKFNINGGKVGGGNHEDGNVGDEKVKVSKSRPGASVADIDPDGDDDGDGVANKDDNCPKVPNPKQEDANSNGIGDICDASFNVDKDDDGDGVNNGKDNCRTVANPNQADTDKDGVGDACDICPRTPNAPETMGEPQVNVCEPFVIDPVNKTPTNKRRDDFVKPTLPVLGDGDKDNDTILDKNDNCPDEPNNTQTDKDNDGVGDACDICPGFPNPPDPITGLQPNYCDSSLSDYDPSRRKYIDDKDSDTVPDGLDNCPDVPNPAQKDRDNDGIGDRCDNCPDLMNASQENSWKTGDPPADKDKGDACKSYPAGERCSASGPACPDSKNGAKQVCATDVVPSSILPGGEGICVCDATKSTAVHVARPRVMLILDASSSMDDVPGRQKAAKDALDALVDAYANRVDFGILYFGYNQTSDSNAFDKRYNYTKEVRGHQTSYFSLKKVRSYPASILKTYWSSYPAIGNTPTAEAFRWVRTEHMLGFRGDTDTYGSVIPRAAILLTDGAPNDAAEAKKESANLYNDGVELHVVGVKYGTSSSSLEECAEAGSGGKRSFLNGDNATNLTNILTNALKETMSCELKLSNTNKSNRVYVYMDGKLLKRGGVKPDYTFDYNTGVVTLKNDACQALRSSSSPKLTAALACPEKCEPSINPKTGKPFKPSESEFSGGFEFCTDGIDNNCDGRVDEGCEDKVPEICGNNKDDDGNGIADDGCPNTKKVGEHCTKSIECQNFNECIEGICRPAVCGGSGQDCVDASDCCGAAKCTANKCVSTLG